MRKGIVIASELERELDLSLHKCPYGDGGCVDQTCERCEDDSDRDPDYMSQETFLYLPKHYK
jgi:hypothetical protein